MENFIIFIKNNTEKVALTFLVIAAVTIGSINYPPLISLWENSVIYNNFRPDIKPPIVLAIQKGGDSVGFHGIGYTGLIISRYVSDIFGHSLSIVRFPSVLYGLLSLLLFYVITKRWFGWKTAALSAALLMTNINFIIFEHTLMVQMLTLMLIFFFIERYQNLNAQMNLPAAIWLGFACSLLSMQNIAGRVYMLAVLLLFILEVDWTKLRTQREELTKQILSRLKLLGITVGSMAALLFLFFPLNLKYLFNKEFIFSSLGEYSTSVIGMIMAAAHNALYFARYFMAGALSLNTPLDVMLTVPYPIENIFVIILFVAGTILCLPQLNKKPVRFLYYSILVFFAASLTSATYPGLTGVLSTTFGITRVIYLIPFIILFAVLGLKYFYDLAAWRTKAAGAVFAAVAVIILASRAGSYAIELDRFSSYMDSNKFNAFLPAIEAKWDWKHSAWDMPPEEKRKLIFNQNYFRDLAGYIKDNINDIESKPRCLNIQNKFKILEPNIKRERGAGPYFIYVPSNYYTPEYYTYGGGDMPYRGHPYYFEMYLTFYLQEEGVYSSYLVRKADYRNFAGRFLDKLSRNKKIFGKIGSNPIGRPLLAFVQNLSNGYPGEEIGEKYFVNDTGWGKPKAIIISDKDQLAAVKKLKGSRIVLELPRDAKKIMERK